MFAKIMVPVDLTHEDRLAKTLGCAADLAGHWKAAIVFVGVASSAPGKLGHTPEEFRARLDAFASAQAAAHGIAATGHAVISHDPTSDLDRKLLEAVRETGADLVVMASHVPGIADYILSSHGGTLAEHAGVSVMLIRG